MSHLGTLRTYRFTKDVDDIRGTNVYGRNDEVLGEIDDVIFDHGSGEIQYAVVDTGGWLSSNKFLVPADRISGYKDTDDFYVDLTKEQIERFPKYDEKVHENQARWDDYEARYRDSWTTTGDVLHREGSPNGITPDPDEMPAATGDVRGDFTPDRMAPTFTDPAPGPGKIRMRPAGLASEAEDTKNPGTARGSEIEQPENQLQRDAERIRARDEDLDDACDMPGRSDIDVDDSSAYSDIRRTVVPRSSATDPASYQQHVGEVRDDLSRPYPVQQGRSERWRAFEESLRRNRVDVTASCHSCGPARDNAA